MANASDRCSICGHVRASHQHRSYCIVDECVCVGFLEPFTEEELQPTHEGSGASVKVDMSEVVCKECGSVNYGGVMANGQAQPCWRCDTPLQLVSR